MYHATTVISITMYKTAAGLKHPPIHGYQVLFPQAGCEADYTPPPTAKVNKTWSSFPICHNDMAPEHGDCVIFTSYLPQNITCSSFFYI